MAKTTEQANKALVLEAFDTLFNKRDYKAAGRYWSANYLQHSAHIKPGRDGLFNLIRSSPSTLRYEPGTIVAEGDYVIVHGRFTNTGRPKNWIAADVVRVADEACGFVSLIGVFDEKFVHDNWHERMRTQRLSAA
jgi:predicted SnoaL-like aldol condensation-catalyzing enzyme